MATSSDRRFPRNLTDRLSCRQVLNIMVILGFMFNYMLRVNLTIAIVAMVIPSNKTDISHTSATATECSDPGNATLLSDKPTQLPESFDGLRFQWDEYEQNIILGCFFWGYVMTELPGGRLAEIIGGHRVFGYSMLSASVLTLLTPVAARLDYTAVVVLRVLLGLMLGATWPAIHPMTARWIPPTERSKFMSNMMASSLGAAITMPVCGFLIASLGWESVFYVTGVVGLVWSIAWFFLVFDSPAQHPRISEEERRYIESSIGGATSHGKVHRVPWLRILTSPCVWAIIITHGASVFGYFTVVNQLPTYMKHILHFNIKANGLLSSLPYLGKYVFAVLTSALADHLLRTERLSRTATRKIFTAFALGVPSVTMIGQMFLGCDRAASVTFFTVALTVNGAVCGGYLGNGLDIAPNFSGTIFGMANTLSSLGGFLSSLMVGMLTQDNQTYAQWRKVFGIIAGTYAGGAVVYTAFGTGRLQSWNAVHTDDKDGTEPEKFPLRSDKA
ncbi:Sialin [Cryptotermes secundus]|uniref:Sialin n=1 Tax=Cryptotermes secundus TaxID=105785 RepID=A0A2J7QI18_9NEOP|nr:sialin isoform X1 [Cryptotermes secundus]PNF28216.1 Sialin [Cryptotermes secundus]